LDKLIDPHGRPNPEQGRLFWWHVVAV
jgi:hypothetical protein